MTKVFEIMDTQRGLGYGIYRADSEQHAFDLMAQQAGYTNFAAMIEAKPSIDELDISELDLKDEYDTAAFLRHIIDENDLRASDVTFADNLLRANFPRRRDAERLTAALRSAGFTQSNPTEATEGWLVESNLEDTAGDSSAADSPDILVAELIFLRKALR